MFFFFSSRRRHTRCSRDWSSDVCSSDLRPLRTGECHRLFAVAGLGADLETGVLEQGPEVEPDDRLVLSDQNPHLCWVSLAETAQPRDRAGGPAGRFWWCGSSCLTRNSASPGPSCSV